MDSIKYLILHNLKNNSNTYLDSSKVCNGVGVFALTDIPKDTILFVDVPPDSYFFSWEELSGIDDRILNKLKSLCNTDISGINLPSSLNNFNFSFFVNHSDVSNVYHNKEKNQYISIKDINAGDEIVCSYDSNEIDWK